MVGDRDAAGDLARAIGHSVNPALCDNGYLCQSVTWCRSKVVPGRALATAEEVPDVAVRGPV